MGRFPSLSPDDPQMVAGYVLNARLGAGGMGQVYLSYTNGERAVAVKVLRPEFALDPEFRRRFRQETEAAKMVHGSHTAPVIDAAPDANPPWLATAYVAGPSLQEAVAEHGRLPVNAVFRLLGGIAEALGAIHSAGLVHRDLKPANVLLSGNGPRVIDFGIARAAESTTTASEVRVGTPAYMAPEQVRGQAITSATDVFALGQTALYAATGRTAFGEGDAQVLFYRIVNEPPQLTDCPSELAELLERCLSSDPADRPTPAEIVGFARANIPKTLGSWLPPAIAATLHEYAPPPFQHRLVKPSPGTPPRYGLDKHREAPPRYGDAPPTIATPVSEKPPVPLTRWSARRKAAAAILALVTAGATVAVTVRVTLSYEKGIGTVPATQQPTISNQPTPTVTITVTDSPTVTPTPTPTPTPTEDAGDIPESFLGTWTGTVTQPDARNYQKYPVRLTLRRGKLGDPVGETHYGLLNCSGELTLTDFSETYVEVQEEVVSDPDATCLDVRITLRRASSGRLSYAFRSPSRGSATLHRD